MHIPKGAALIRGNTVYCPGVSIIDFEQFKEIELEQFEEIRITCFNSFLKSNQLSNEICLTLPFERISNVVLIHRD